MGPVNFTLAPKAALTTILYNFGQGNLKVSVHNNSAHAAVSLVLAPKPSVPETPSATFNVAPKSTVVFTVGASCQAVNAYNSSHNEGSAVIAVIYE